MTADLQRLLAEQNFAAAFECLVPEFKDKVFRLAVSLLRNESQAEDVTQEVFVKIWKGLPGFHGDAALSTWIYTITRNTCLTELRKRETRPTVSLHAPELAEHWDSLPALQAAETSPDASMDMPALLDQLPGHYRQVITLFYYEQKAYEEVAAMLGIPVGTVKTYLYRAKKELLRLVSRQPQPGLPAQLLANT